jgi:Cdc6-like AAA superfamily ATPase
MSYIKPDLVISPKNSVSDLRVIYDGGENSWSLAEMKWEGDKVMALRWNGGSTDQRFPGIGNPQSRGVPTWFILPDEIGEIVVDMLRLNKKISFVKKVIALYGKANIGKSNTVKEVYKLLRTKYPSCYVENEVSGLDISVVLTINRVKIGIDSQGDPNTELEKRLLEFVEIGCEIIICTTRTRGETVNAVDRLGYEVLWLDQEIQSELSEQENSNCKMANKIVEEVEKIIE